MAPAPANDYIGQALSTLQSVYDDYLSSTLPPPLNGMVSSAISTAVTAQPYISGLLGYGNNFITNIISGNGGGGGGGGANGTGVVSTILLVLSLYIGLRVMNYIRRSIMGWVFLAFKLGFALVAVQVLVYVNTYGWDKSVRDASWLGGIVWGFAEDMLEGNTQDKVPRGTRGRNTGRAKTGNGKTGWI